MQRFAASQSSLNVDGTSSTPGALGVPQMGVVSFRCDRAWRAQPVFDAHGALATEEVTIHGGKLTRRNFTRRLVGHDHGRPLWETRFSAPKRIALPFAHYHTVVFTLHQGTEARILDTKVTAQWVAGIIRKRSGPRLGACFVKRWLLSMNVS